MRVLPIIGRGALLLAIAAGGLACSRGPDVNVVLITVDTLRADHLGAMGYPHGTTPALDAFLAESTAFTTAVVPRSQTWPTLASVLTSRYPVTHGVRKNGQSLAEGMRTLGEEFGAHGYACAAFLSNSGKAAWPGFDPLVDLRDRDRTLLARARGWLRGRNPRRPFFLWFHFFAPHRPFQPPKAYVERFDRNYRGVVDGSIQQMKQVTVRQQDLSDVDLRHMIARYDGEIRYFDRMLGGLLRTLEDEGLRDNTLVVLTADHGEELYERQRYFSHSASIYDTVLHVPLAFRRPGHVDSGRWIPGIVESVDIAPTTFALARLPASPQWEGRNLQGVIAGHEAPDRQWAAFSELEDRMVSFRSEDYRYIHNPENFDFPMEGGDTGVFFRIDPEELYVHATDPAERRNRVADLPGVVAELRMRVLDWMEAHDWDDGRRRHAESEIPEQLRESLEAIGYVN